MLDRYQGWGYDCVTEGSIGMENSRRLSRKEIIDVLDRDARHRRDMSGPELIRAYHNGELEEPGEVVDLIAMAHLLRDDDPYLQAD